MSTQLDQALERTQSTADEQRSLDSLRDVHSKVDRVADTCTQVAARLDQALARAQGTADDVLWPMLQAKLEVLNQAGLSKDNFQGMK